MKNLFKLFTLVLVVGLALSTTAWGQTTLSQWTFEAIGTSTNTGVSWTGSPTVADAGVLTTGSVASGLHSNASTVWSSPTGNGSARSLSSNYWSVGNYYQFKFSTTDYYGISIIWDQTGSSTGPRDFKVQYSTDGSSFTDATGTNSTYSLILSNWSSSTNFPEHTRTLNLSSVIILDNKPNVYIRLVNTTTTSINGGTVATTGTGRVDNFIVNAATYLPIQLASFVGSYFENGAKLEWSTISEVNNYGFNVQRLNGENFETVGFVAGKGTTLEPQSYEYIDANPSTSYRLEQIDNDGLTNYYGPIYLNPNSVGDNSVPAVFALNQNYPNPFNPSTIINYQLTTDNYTTLKVYNLIGKEVATLVNGYVTAGSHQVTFDGSHLTSGMYFYKLQSGNNVEVKKLTLVK